MEIRNPSHRLLTDTSKSNRIELENLRDFFGYQIGGENETKSCMFKLQMNDEATVELESNARVWHNPSGPGGGAGYRLSFTDSAILRCSTYGMLSS